MMKRASLTTIVRRALEGECALPSGTTLVVAVSGGPDSMALLDVLARLSQRFGLSLLAHGVDHGLRAQAASELDIAEVYSNDLGIPFSRTCVKVTTGGNLQARARKLRWEALTEVARRHEATIATAHHADDRAETLLMRMLRGAGARGLAVLPPRAEAPGAIRGPIIRPLLRARRLDIEAHVARRNVPHAHDPSNVDPRYLRTSVRRAVLPLLAKLDPNIVGHLEAIADELSEQANPRAATGSRARPSALAEWTASLPRPTQEALLKMTEAPSATSRVWLPGGLVVSVDPRARAKRATQARTRVVRSHPRG